MEIRKSELKDVDRMLEIFDVARNYMRHENNLTQWINHPTKEILIKDIEKGISYVVLDNNKIIATFVFFVGIELTYKNIEGSWLDEDEYGVIHRLASSMEVKGVLKNVLEFCFSFIKNIRVDTHNDNKTMNYLLREQSFIKCGIIYISDNYSSHSPRIAYQKRIK